MWRRRQYWAATLTYVLYGRLRLSSAAAWSKEHGLLSSVSAVSQYCAEDVADETTANRSSVSGQHTDRQQDCLRVSMGSVLPSYDAVNTNTRSACPSQTAAGSYPSCPPPAYTAATSPFSHHHQQQQTLLRPNENYIRISNRIQAVTQSDDCASANRESGGKIPDDSVARCVCIVFWIMGVAFCCLAPGIIWPPHPHTYLFVHCKCLIWLAPSEYVSKCTYI